MKKEKIKTVDGQTLLDMRLPQIRFVVEGLLPQGLHILAGAAKTRKIVAAASALSAGGAGQAVLEFADRKRNGAVTVLRGQPQPYPAAADGSDGGRAEKSPLCNAVQIFIGRTV